VSKKSISLLPLFPADLKAKGGTNRSGSRRSALFLRPYQIQGIQYLRSQNGCGVLFWDMRLGKTLPTIRFLSQRSDAHRILVIAPYSALSGWESDLVRENKIVYSIFKVKPKDRNAVFNILRFGWHLINKESFLYCDYLQYNWDAVICDETWLTNPKAKITKYFLKSPKPKYRILLTGTPAPESELQYFPQLHWVNPNILNVKSYWDYRIRYFRPVGFEWVISLKGKKFLSARLAQYCSILRRSDVNLNKEVIYEERKIKLLETTRKKYNAIESALVDDMILKYAGERWNECRRVCSGKEKEIELLSLVEGELKNEKIIIWADYVEEVERIAALLHCHFVHGGVNNTNRDKIKEAFLNDQRILVAQPQCWKWGTNLSGVDIVIFFSMPQGLMTWQQVRERTVDLSSKQSLLIILLLAEYSIEEDIVRSLHAKETREQQIDSIRRSIIARQSARTV
jgi:SNF2 family DNA or RNA helicase